MRKIRVYIAYPHDAKGYAEEVFKRLKRVEWLDPYFWPENRISGNRLTAVQREKMHNSDAVVAVVATMNWHAPNFLNELKWAQDDGIWIHPITLTSSKRYLPKRIRDLDLLLIKDGPSEILKKLIEDLKSVRSTPAKERKENEVISAVKWD